LPFTEDAEDVFAILWQNLLYIKNDKDLLYALFETAKKVRQEVKSQS